MNAIANFHIVMEDMDISKKKIGRDVISLKFKSTKAKPRPVHRDDTEIPK